AISRVFLPPETVSAILEQGADCSSSDLSEKSPADSNSSGMTSDLPPPLPKGGLSTMSTSSIRSTPQVPGYVVLEVLGRGGMGVVYRAHDPRLGRVVALKMIRSAEHADQDERARFLSESRAVAALQHPHIV